jgi:hypothetical protein
MQTNVIMSSVDQSFEISEHITLKRGLTITGTCTTHPLHRSSLLLWNH